MLIRLRRALIVCAHLALVPLGYGLAYLLRFDGNVPPRYVDLFLVTAPALTLLRVVTFARFRLLSGWWRHVDIFDLQALVGATTVSSLVFAAYAVLAGALPGIPRSVLVLDWGVALVLFGGVRFAVRWSRERGFARAWEVGGRRALIVGAGDTAVHLLRQLRADPAIGINPVGLVDDDPNKSDLQLHGIPVLGTTRDLERLVREKSVSLLVLAIPDATPDERRKIAQRCSGLPVEIKVVPTLPELIGGRARLTELRGVELEELLGRAPVMLDLAPVESDLKGRVVLITGGAGSIGAELARQVAGFGPARLVLLEQAESPLYFIDLELRSEHPRLDLVSVVGSVTRRETVESVFATHRPDYVFHAAAYKHVPLMQDHVSEAVRNNVFGTLRVAECAARYGTDKFVLISTDKAVRPSSVMGATKRIAERIVLALPSLRASRTDFRAVRFGNVLGSAGSVVPLFRRQIAAGGPVTVTDPEVTRYFMTIPEAVQLVLQASAVDEAAGRVSMLEMGAPVKILDMAENLIRLSGLAPYDDVPIVFTGMRPGEKLHEELMSSVERTVPTPVERVRVVHASDDDAGAVEDGVRRLEQALEGRDKDEVMLWMSALAPDAVSPLRDRYREVAARRAIRPSRMPKPAGQEPSEEPATTGAAARWVTREWST